MDRNWMLANRLSREYRDGVEEFIKFAVENANDPEKIPCPCMMCLNANHKGESELRYDLFRHGIDGSYTCWSLHGEKDDTSINMDTPHENEILDSECEEDHLEDMMQAAGEDFCGNPKKFEGISRDAEEPLYASCSKFTKLSAVLKLYNLKAANGWTDKSFTALLELLKDMLPDDNVLPDCTYMAKQMIKSLGMNYERIHACPNDCVLYRKEYAELQNCPTCHESRYKREGVPAKVLWYFPIIPRFRRLFSNVEDAKNLRWHEEERDTSDGKIRHPADSTQWVNFDDKHKSFSGDGRNLRLALSTDGMNPHGNQSTSHSTWPVILVIYNLPPWLCMRRKYMMLSLLISGPKQPGVDIDVYLAPLIEDLKLLWDDGVEVYDAYGEETFSLRAMLFCTINDFPAYGNLSGYTTKGYHACPVCQESTDSRWLTNSKKVVYLGHRRFLPIAHRFRRLKKAFNGKAEDRRAPHPLTTEQLMAKISGLNMPFGKKRDVPPPSTGWKKKSIFYCLPYWEDLPVKHCVDVMHVEKNCGESMFGTLLMVRGRTKDTVNARKDMEGMGIRLELHPQEDGCRTILPPACHTLSKRERQNMCKFFSEVKVPYGYSANVKSLVNLKEGKLQGMKSHDYHVLLQELLPVAIRGILPKNVRYAITRLCFFFKRICEKVIDPLKLDSLQKDIVVTLCEMEMYFPPSFFDIMVHLTVHLVREIQFCGPVYLRWMYPFERYMKVLKGYVMNRFRPEGCMVERYIVEEAVEFCNQYLSGTAAIGIPKTINEDGTEGKGTAGFKLSQMCKDEWEKAHLCVLHNTEVVQPYVDEHVAYLRMHNSSRRNEKWITDEHTRSFSTWLKAKICDCNEQVAPTLKWLSKGPDFHVTSFTTYEINHYTFYTQHHDSISTVQSSGISLVAQSGLIYYGVIEEIWELDYRDLKVPIFRCKWVDITHGVNVDELGFRRVNLSKVGHKDDPFVMASQVKQVFYVPDPLDSKWSIVISTKERVRNEYSQGNWEVMQPSVQMPSPPIDINEDTVYMREDHGEGIVIQNSYEKSSNRKRKK